MLNGYEYLLKASSLIDGDGDLWFRYLHKVLNQKVVDLNKDDIKKLLNCHQLKTFEKVTLKEALIPGSNIREHILSYNKKTKSKDILKLFKEGRYGKGCI